LTLVSPSVAQRGNVLVILADDLGVDKVGAYQPVTSPPPPATPTLDALATKGLLFRNAYANPLCAPSRAAMQTGRYGFRNGIGGNLSGSLPLGPLIVTPFGSTLGNQTMAAQSLDLDEIVIAEMLDRGGSGFAHGMFGKWHLGRADFLGVPGHPKNHGYGHFAGSRGNFPVRANPPEDYFFWTRVSNGSSKHVTKYSTSDCVDSALAWISVQQRNAWFCTVSFQSPHGPLHRPPGSSLPNAAPIGGEPAWPYYNAMVSSMDAEIGRLLQGVVAAGFSADDVTVIFMGDNGTSSQPRGPKQLVFPPFNPAHSKGSVYEGGTHVPLIVAGPHVAQIGSSTNALVSIVDLFATVAELAGVDLDDPAVIPTATTIDSVSFVPVLENPGHPGDRQFVFTETFGPNNPEAGVAPGNRAVRGARYKLIELGNGSSSVQREMYDLARDPHETKDLLSSGTLTPGQQAAYAGLRKSLKDLLQSR
jgi:arylsulfatase A-like enzyme